MALAVATSVSNSQASTGSSGVPPSCENMPSSIEPTSGFDLKHPSTIFNRDAASWAWIICAIIAVLASAISAVSIFKHLRNFNKPLEQSHIVRILLFVPIYALVSWAAFRYYWHAVYIFTLRDCYEAFVIYSFYALILQFLGPTVQVQKMALVSKNPMPYPMWGPIFKWKYDPASPTFLQRNKILVLQYVVVRPLMTVVALVTQLTSRFCSESMSVFYGHFWYSVINFVSVSACMYGLVILYFTIKDDIAEHKPLPKFLSIKIVIFLTMLQNMILSTLAHYGYLPETQYWTSTNISNGIQSILVCIEMLIASIFHISAFSEKEYRAPSGAHTPWIRALVMAFNVVDIFREIGSSFTHLVQWMSGRQSNNKNGATAGSSGTIVYADEEIIEEGVYGKVAHPSEFIPVASKDERNYGTHA
ncbi:hypothetical protein HDU99_010504 [Rhizoclosmatium hyalinum]|nr:hypothetical protein HDU99_010504 [Rhizoclosmatium hyalinum]